MPAQDVTPADKNRPDAKAVRKQQAEKALEAKLKEYGSADTKIEAQVTLAGIFRHYNGGNYIPKGSTAMVPRKLAEEELQRARNAFKGGFESLKILEAPSKPLSPGKQAS